MRWCEVPGFDFCRWREFVGESTCPASWLPRCADYIRDDAYRHMHVTFLTPNLPPSVCGLADHTRLLGAALARRGYGVSIVARRRDASTSTENIAGWVGATAIWDGTSGGLLRFLGHVRADWLWVQLSGYGYSRFGAPWKLSRTLKVVRRHYPDLRFAVCVHETYCHPDQLGPKGRVLSAWQRFTVGQILRQGDLVLPTIPLFLGQCLHEYRLPPARLELLPIAASTAAVRLTEEQRSRLRRELGLAPSDRVAVTFGRWNSQRMALERLGPTVQRAIDEGSLSSVIAVGGENSMPPEWIGEFMAKRPWAGRLQVLGKQPAERIAEVLAVVDVGLVPTPWPVWEKSSAARAFEQAGLTLWIFDHETRGCRVMPPNPKPPTWETIAEILLERLSHAGAD